jgi:hypothetical protein
VPQAAFPLSALALARFSRLDLTPAPSYSRDHLLVYLTAPDPARSNATLGFSNVDKYSGGTNVALNVTLSPHFLNGTLIEWITKYGGCYIGGGVLLNPLK